VNPNQTQRASTTPGPRDAERDEAANPAARQPRYESFARSDPARLERGEREEEPAEERRRS
jgi:hypothetical protein